MKKLLAAVTVLAVSTAQAGTIYVDDDGPACGPSSDCCIDNGTPGCDSPRCETSVCMLDSHCCDSVWDSVCADLAFLFCAICTTPQGSGTAADPYCSIQLAIGHAVDTDEIVVAPGTYFETINFNGKSIVLRSSDGPDVTIINAGGEQVTGSVVTCDSGESAESVLEGFTITGGTGTVVCSLPGCETRGGGMYNLASSPTVTNCTFSMNSANSYGGGMFNSAGNPTVTNCTFHWNSSSTGGGMFNSAGNPTVINCTFSSNSATSGSGGGMFNSAGSPTVINCTFKGNIVANGGGGMANSSSSPTVTNCTFGGNNAANGGGGGMANSNSNPTVTNCTFGGNNAGDDGGGMANSNSNPTVINCTFGGNNAGDDGGGMYNANSQISPTVVNCILWGNSPDEFGGSGTPTVIYSNVQGGFAGTGNIDADPLFVDPDNDDFRLQAGSLCIDAGDNTAVPEDITTDLDGNPRFLEIPETPDTGNGTLPIVDMGAYESLGGGCLAVTSQEIVCHADGSTFTVNIEGLNACTGGTTQVTFTASGGSVGDALCFTALVNDGGFCCTTEICVTIPDCTPAALPSDLDGDGVVGMVDFLALLADWGPCSDCGTCPADFDGDCSVGILDLLILLGSWG
jgi:hypothetical protein